MLSIKKDKCACPKVSLPAGIMRPSWAVALWMLCLCLVSCGPVGLNRKIHELDRELDRADVYVMQLEHRSDSLRSILDGNSSDTVKWEAGYKLFSSYLYVSLDSTAKYCGLLQRYSVNNDLEYRTVVCRLNLLRQSGEVERMKPLLDSVDVSAVSREFISEYYFHLQRALDKVYDSLCINYIREAAACPDILPDIRSRMSAILCMRFKDYDGAREHFLDVYRQTGHLHLKAMSAYNLAELYKKAGDEYSCMWWYAESAINDIKFPCKEYAALPELALMLIQKNRYRAASKYLNISMRDAIDGQWNTNVFNYVGGQIPVAESLVHTANVLILLIVVVGVFAVLLLSLYVNVARQKRQLRRVNRMIIEMNRKLKDEGKIKEAYLFSYMALAVKYLGQVDSYRHDLRKAMKEEGVDAVRAMLRSPGHLDSYKEFYEKFDTTFRRIYPDFVPKVNLLLEEGARFEDEVPFSTDLRILATIRLGFRESRQIAAFLNMPVTSIYTRRSTIKRSTLCGKDVFEDKIREII